MNEDDFNLADDEEDELPLIIDVALEDDEDEEVRPIENPDVIQFEGLELLVDDEESDESYLFEEDDYSIGILEDDEDQDAEIIDVYENKELVVQEENSKSLVINKKLRQETGIKSFPSFRDENLRSYMSISNSLVNKLISDKQIESKIMNDLLTKNIPFLNEKLQSQIKKRIDEVDDSIDSTNKLFDSLDIDPVYDTEIHHQLFYKHVQSVRKSSFLTRREMKDSTTIRNKFSIEYTNELLKDQTPALPMNLVGVEPKNTVMSKLLVLGPRSVTCTCGNCDNVFHYSGDLISISKSPEINFIGTPLVCPSCNKINLLPQKILRNIRSKTRDFVEKLKPLDSDNGSLIYVPKISDICESMPELFEEEIKQSVEESSVSIDWDKYKKEFLTNVETFYILDKSINKNTKGIKNIAKILGNQSNDYVDLKEKSIATFIQFMKTTNLNCLSKSYIEELKVLTYYSDHFDEFYEAIGDSLAMDNEDRSKESIKVAYSEYLKDFASQKDLIDSYINQLSKNAKLFSNLPIISTRLNEEDIEEYLSDERLREAIDLISDYMIVTNLAESFIEGFEPRKLDPEKGVSQKAGSFEAKFRNLRNINKVNKLTENTIQFLKYFDPYILSNGDTEPRLNNFIVCDETGYSLFESLSSICSLLGSSDYYEAYKQRNELLNNHSDFFNKFSNSPRYSIIFNFLCSFPSIDLSIDKFGFYFPTETNLTKEEKDKILNLIKVKKKIPSELVGDTFTDKYNYFKNLENQSNVKLWRDDVVYEFKSKYLVVIEAVACLGINNYKDFLTYSISRDLLLSFEDLDISDFCKIFCLNEDVCRLYMNEDFTYDVVEFRKKKLFTSLIFKSSYLNKLVEEYNANPSSEISTFFADESLQMIDDLKDLPEPSKILNESLSEEGL